MTVRRVRRGPVDDSGTAGGAWGTGATGGAKSGTRAALAGGAGRGAAPAETAGSGSAVGPAALGPAGLGSRRPTVDPLLQRRHGHRRGTVRPNDVPDQAGGRLHLDGGLGPPVRPDDPRPERDPGDLGPRQEGVSEGLRPGDLDTPPVEDQHHPPTDGGPVGPPSGLVDLVEPEDVGLGNRARAGRSGWRPRAVAGVGLDGRCSRLADLVHGRYRPIRAPGAQPDATSVMAADATSSACSSSTSPWAMDGNPTS